MPGDIPDAVGAVVAAAVHGLGLSLADSALAGQLAVQELRRQGWQIREGGRRLLTGRQEPLRVVLLAWLEVYAPDVSTRDADRLLQAIEGRRTTAAAVAAADPTPRQSP